MRIKELFTVPNGKKVTEKVFGRVLISSICSILLCMACLAGTTWAWFTVSIENMGNVIQTADVPKYILQVDGQSFISGENLPVGEHTVSIAHASNADDLQKKSKLYVTFTLGDIPHGYIILGGDNSEVVNVTVSTEKDISFSWSVSWFAPGNPDVNPLIDNIIQITAEDPSEESSTEESTETSSETTDSPFETTKPSTDTTTPTEAITEPPAEETTTSTTEATEAATEAATIPTITGETTESSETTSATEETTIPATDATITPTTEPTSIPTEATEPVTEPGGTTSPTETG